VLAGDRLTALVVLDPVDGDDEVLSSTECGELQIKDADTDDNGLASG